MNRFKKTIILGLILFLTSACSAEYDLEFKNGNLHEKTTIKENAISISENVKGDFEKYREYYIPSIIPIGNINNEDMTIKVKEQKYYKNRHNFSSDEYNLIYKYKFNTTNYKDAYLPNYANEYFNFLSNGKSYIISTSKNYKVFDEFSSLNNISVHIKSNHKLISTNADQVDGYNYYWNINRGDNKTIYLEVAKKEYIFNYENDFIYLVIKILVAALIILYVVLYHYKKLKKMNEV